ncbi:preprotein translocase subunit SecE [Enterococcus faecalis]
MKFFRNVADEMKKVTWPTKKQLRKDTLIVIETSVLFAVLFFIMDTVIQTVFNWILN